MEVSSLLSASPARARRRALAAAAAAAAGAALLAGCASHPVRAAKPTPPAPARASADGWSAPLQLPGIAALDKGGTDFPNALSCSSADTCSAGGFYEDSAGINQAFVISETGGTWQPAREVAAALNTNASDTNGAQVSALACAPDGSCVAGGYYQDGPKNQQAFLVSETGGRWQPAQEVPGIGALNTGGLAEIKAVSCPSAGNCVAGGDYSGAAGIEAFVVSETGGRWQPAQEVPGIGALNVAKEPITGAEVDALSCPSAGNCSAAGTYDDAADRQQAFVASQTGGTWQRAQELPGIRALNRGGVAFLLALSCSSAGNCSAGGHYEDIPGNDQGYAVSEVNGTWQQAQEVPGSRRLTTGGLWVTTMSCESAGNCSAGGHYIDKSEVEQAFVVSETGGTWRQAQELPGSGALNRGGEAEAGAAVNGLSCTSPGNCTAGGEYVNAAENNQAFVARQVHGHWRDAEQVGGAAVIHQVSCVPAGRCTAVGTSSSELIVTSKP